jgi:3-methyladenine DNA glycosylase/8-oxoguanine DNA glycosylase
MHGRALAHLRKADPVIAAIIARVGPCRLRPVAEGTHFDSILKAIVYQQLSGSAASTIHGRVRALLQGERSAAKALLQLPEAKLRAAGLSRQKLAYVRDLARKVVDRELAIERLHELGNEAIIESLTAVHGVGTWTAEMFLMFRLGRPDVLPVHDYGIRKAMQRAYRLRDLPKPKRMLELAASWSPHRTVASWYLWRSLEVDGVAGSPPEKRQSAAATAKPKR